MVTVYSASCERCQRLTWHYTDSTCRDCGTSKPFDAYRLPDGTIVQVDATAAKGLAVIGFQLVGGKIVDAVRCEGGTV